MESQKPVHTLVLDTGSIIKNEPSVSTLIGQSECLVTVPAIISEIKDAATRSRVETTLRPFLTLRTPSPTSIKFVTDFARRTGDLAVLSKPDIQIIALTYEIECERNSGDWRLRKAPGQKGLNGAPPAKATEPTSAQEPEISGTSESSNAPVEDPHTSDVAAPTTEGESEEPQDVQPHPTGVAAEDEQESTENAVDQVADPSNDLSTGMANTSLGEQPSNDETRQPVEKQSQDPAAAQEDSDSDSDGWITPSNLKKKQLEDSAGSTVQTPEPKTMQVAVLTTDFAMQNVIMQINLNLLSPSMNRVKHLKTFVLRCHACFLVTKEMSRQFCPRCGQPNLTRVACSTNANGEFKLHLKKNMQWNHRGDRFSIPKAVHGSPHGRVKGGGKGGWGNDLILTEDQKEFERAKAQERRQKERNLMDEDYLPGILTGDRGKSGGRIKVGAGKNVNSRKR